MDAARHVALAALACGFLTRRQQILVELVDASLQAGHAVHHFADGLGLLHDLFGMVRVFARKAGGNLLTLG